MINNEPRIAVLGAMSEEILAIKQLMTDVKVVKSHGYDFIVGQINNKAVVVTLSGVGKVASAISVTLLNTLFSIKSLVFTGIAGAVNSELNIGDIVISENLFQYDVDARPNFPIYEIPFFEKAIFPVQKKLVNKATTAIELLLKDKKFNSSINSENININAPKYIKGVIGSGDKFITKSTITKSIDQMLFDQYQLHLDCIEMEGAAVAQCCYQFNTPFVVIRIISDKPSSTTIKDYKAFKHTVAKHYTKNIIDLLIGSS